MELDGDFCVVLFGWLDIYDQSFGRLFDLFKKMNRPIREHMQM